MGISSEIIVFTHKTSNFFSSEMHVRTLLQLANILFLKLELQKLVFQSQPNIVQSRKTNLNMLFSKRLEVHKGFFWLDASGKYNSATIFCISNKAFVLQHNLNYKCYFGVNNTTFCIPILFLNL